MKKINAISKDGKSENIRESLRKAKESTDKVYAILNINGVNAMRAKYGDIVKVIYCKCNIELLYQRMLDRGDSKAKAAERIRYLLDNGELSFDSSADIILETDKLNLEECKEIVKNFIVRAGE